VSSLGDGIFDELSNRDVVDTVWKTIENVKATKGDKYTKEDVVKECVNNLIRRAMLEKSEDNLSVIVVFFKSLF
jgi:serine/threonine protein phosphatase PrpC